MSELGNSHKWPQFVPMGLSSNFPDLTWRKFEVPYVVVVFFQHFHREIYDMDGTKLKSDNALWVVPLDYLGVSVGPMEEILNISTAKPLDAELLYYGLPFIYPMMDMIRLVSNPFESPSKPSRNFQALQGGTSQRSTCNPISTDPHKATGGCAPGWISSSVFLCSVWVLFQRNASPL